MNKNLKKPTLKLKKLSETELKKVVGGIVGLPPPYAAN